MDDPVSKCKAFKKNISLTYSQAHLAKFPTRKEFGKCIKKYLNIGSGKVRVQQWAFSQEKHQDDRDQYHN